MRYLRYDGAWSLREKGFILYSGFYKKLVKRCLNGEIWFCSPSVLDQLKAFHRAMVTSWWNERVIPQPRNKE